MPITCKSSLLPSELAGYLPGTCRVLVGYLSGTCRVAVSFTVSFVFWHPLGMITSTPPMVASNLGAESPAFVCISPISVVLPCWNIRYTPCSCVPTDRLCIFESVMYFFNCFRACSLIIFTSSTVALELRYFNSIM